MHAITNCLESMHFAPQFYWTHILGLDNGQSGRETIEGCRREDSQGIESPGDETRASNDGAKSGLRRHLEIACPKWIS